MEGIIESRLYTVEQVSAHLAVSRRTVWRLLESGELPGRHIGRRWYMLGADLLKAGTDAEPEPEPIPALEPTKPKRKRLGHELKV
jgi:excisionase family DNA binding protein